MGPAQRLGCLCSLVFVTKIRCKGSFRSIRLLLRLGLPEILAMSSQGLTFDVCAVTQQAADATTIDCSERNMKATAICGVFLALLLAAGVRFTVQPSCWAECRYHHAESHLHADSFFIT